MQTTHPRSSSSPDLFSRDGKRPVDLQTALERKSDLLFANQTYAKLEAFRARVERDNNTRIPRVVHLSYRASGEEAGSEKSFDYSRRRWKIAGELAFWTIRKQSACSRKHPRSL